MVKVTQADYTAAQVYADWYSESDAYSKQCHQKISEAFAAHRIATIEECAKVVQRRADELRCTAIDADKTVEAILTLREVQ